MNHFRDFQKDTDKQFKLSIKEDICLMTSPSQYHYYIYWVPKEFNRINNIQFKIEGENKMIFPVHLLIDDIVSCDVNENLEIINCATHSQFAFKIYFKVDYQYEVRLIIKYDSYEFSNEFKGQLKSIPFQTDTHIYVDNKVETI